MPCNVSVCVHVYIVTSNNIPALLQMEAVAVASFPKYGRLWLNVLLKHNIMPEVEAMRFLHDLVDIYEVVDKLKLKFPGDTDLLADEVRLFLCANCIGFWHGREAAWQNGIQFPTPFVLVLACPAYEPDVEGARPTHSAN